MSLRQPIMSLLIQINVKGITVLRSIVYSIAEIAAKPNLFDLEQRYIHIARRLPLFWILLVNLHIGTVQSKLSWRYVLYCLLMHSLIALHIYDSTLYCTVGFLPSTFSTYSVFILSFISYTSCYRTRTCTSVCFLTMWYLGWGGGRRQGSDQGVLNDL